MRLVILLALLFVSHALTFAQIGAKTQTGKIFGTWVNNDFGYAMTLLLNSNGSGEFDGSAITFTVQGDILSITQEGTTNKYAFVLQPKTLMLSGGDLDAPISFNRQGTAPASSGSNASQSTTQTSNTKGNTVVGLWSNYGETIEFKNDGQVIYQGQQYPYTINGDHIHVSTAQGVLMMAYSVNGTQLNLTVNGQNLVYEKGKHTTTNTVQKAGTTGGRHVDQSMAGKWCYVNVTTTNSGGVSSDECITLNTDGTYQYYSERSMSANTSSFSSGTSSQNSDTGTWWVDGGKVFYQSQTQGQGSYALEKRNHPKTGDPMIVIDGRAYVTFYNKAPW